MLTNKTPIKHHRLFIFIAPIFLTFLLTTQLSAMLMLPDVSQYTLHPSEISYEKKQNLANIFPSISTLNDPDSAHFCKKVQKLIINRANTKDEGKIGLNPLESTARKYKHARLHF